MLIRCQGILLSDEQVEIEINSLLLMSKTPLNEEFWASDVVAGSECLDIDVVLDPSFDSDPILLVLNCNTIDETELYQINPEFETHNFWINSKRFRKIYDAYTNERRKLRQLSQRS